TCCIDCVLSEAELDPSQRPAGRTGDRVSRRDVKCSFVARAVKASSVSFGHDAAGQMRALPAESDKGRTIEPYKNALVVLCGICKEQGAADRDVIYRCQPLNRRVAASPAKEILDHDPELTGDEGEAGQHKELRKVAAGDVMILRPVDREVPPPLRLLRLGTSV